MDENQQRIEEELQKALSKINMAIFGFYQFNDQQEVESMKAMVVSNDYSKLHDLLYTLGSQDVRVRNIIFSATESLKKSYIPLQLNKN